MKIIPIIATVVAAALFPTAAHAADIYGGSPKDPAPASYEAPFSWTGFYFGAHAGFGTGDVNNDMAISAQGQSIPFSTEDDLDGAVLGVHVGFNFQSGRMVFGIEGSITGSDIDGIGSSNLAGISVNTTTDVDLFARGVGRLGIASGRTLFYVDGGIAYADATTKTSITNGLQSIALGENDESHIGWTLGAGIEHALTDGWIARVNYAHFDFGNETSSNEVVVGQPTGITFTNDRDLNIDTITVGISRKF